MPSLDISAVVISMAMLILSLSFHEAAHAWTSDRLGDPTARMLGRLTINPLAHIDWIGTVLFPLVAIVSHVPLIGWAKPVPVNTQNLRAPRRDFAIVALAGPVSNIILAVAGAAVFSAAHHAGAEYGSRTIAYLARFVTLNVSLAVFNMIPFPPLDGGNILAGIVPGAVAHAIDRLRPYGFIVLYVLMLSGFLGEYMWPIADRISEWLLL